MNGLGLLWITLVLLPKVTVRSNWAWMPHLIQGSFLAKKRPKILTLWVPLFTQGYPDLLQEVPHIGGIRQSVKNKIYCPL
jgi:hypothetical protein